MVVINELLDANEKIIDLLAPMFYQTKNYVCMITNLRILLYSKGIKDHKEIQHSSIDSFVIGRKSYNDIFFISLILLTFGALWLVSGGIAAFTDIFGLSYILKVILMVLFFIGVVITPMGVIGFVFNYFHKYFLQINTSGKESFQFYSNESVLHELLMILHRIKAGEIDLKEWNLSPIPLEQRISGQPSAVFKKVNVKFLFKDNNAKRRAMQVSCEVSLKQNFLQITAELRNKLLQVEKYKDMIQTQGADLISEENIHRFFDLAEEKRINWVLLLNSSFALRNLSTIEYNSRRGILGAEHLSLNFDTQSGKFTIEFSNAKIIAWSTPQKLVPLLTLLMEYRKEEKEKEPLSKVSETNVITNMKEGVITTEEVIPITLMQIIPKVLILTGYAAFLIVGFITPVYNIIYYSMFLEWSLPFSLIYFVPISLMLLAFIIEIIRKSNRKQEEKVGILFAGLCIIVGALILWFELTSLAFFWEHYDLLATLPGVLVISVGAIGFFFV